MKCADRTGEKISPFIPIYYIAEKSIAQQQNAFDIILQNTTFCAIVTLQY
jgi:hypothetical protein